eukprot:12462032-Alexandrium_andersonii.AAC.1
MPTVAGTRSPTAAWRWCTRGPPLRPATSTGLLALHGRLARRPHLPQDHPCGRRGGRAGLGHLRRRR